MSKEDKRAIDSFRESVVADSANYESIKKVEKYDNFKYLPVPYWQDGLFIITA